MTSKNKRPWWQERSAVDDGDDLDDGFEVVEQDDDGGGDWIDRFDFRDYRADRGVSSTDAIWNRYGYYGSSFSDNSRSYKSNAIGSTLSKSGVDFATAKRIESAQRLVQGFVDTFALGNPLRARFSTGVGAVGGEEGSKDVVVSHRPLLDPTLDVSEAHRVMTAQAASAAAHARYGGQATIDLMTAVVDETAFSPLHKTVATILDDYRIDSSFRRDYPGYEDVYAPAQAYVAKGLLGDRAAFDLDDFQGASIANAALNFSDFTDWNGRESEREWWADWATTYAFAEPTTFAAGVQAAIDHLNLPLPPKPETPPDKQKGEGEGEKGDDGDKPNGDDGEKGGDGDDGESGESIWPSEQDENDPSGGQGASQAVDLPVGLGAGVSLTGLANGQSSALEAEDAERVAQASKALVMGRTDKEVGEVYWTANGFRAEYGRYRLVVAALSSANGYIRRAFARSRTAHYATERGHLTGRIDNRSLTRIASDDYRLFSKRVAPSETRYRVWLMVDNSASMRGSEKIVGNLAASVALAVRHVPNVALDVWAWTTGIKVAGAKFSAVRVYADGDPITKIGDVGLLPQGGTPDNVVLSWAAREIRKQCRPDETPVILMASDGQGGLASEVWMRDPKYLANYPDEVRVPMIEKAGDDRVVEARRAGIKVMSIAIGSGLSEDSQEKVYGKGNYLKWEGSLQKMAKPLGDLLARVASNRA